MVGQPKLERRSGPAWSGAPRPELLPGMGPLRMGGAPWVAQARTNRGVSTTPIQVGQLRVIGEGRPLEPGIRQIMESFFQAEFSGVRVHEGPAAPALGALAFTLGEDLHFAPGLYEPGSREGLALLGHELTHVVQQRDGRVANPYGQGIASVQDPVLEAEADAMGHRVADHVHSQLLARSPRKVVQQRIGPLSRFGRGVPGTVPLAPDRRAAGSDGRGGLGPSRGAHPFSPEREAVRPDTGGVVQWMKRRRSEGEIPVRKSDEGEERDDTETEEEKEKTPKEIEEENFKQLREILTLNAFGGPQAGYVVNGTKDSAPGSPPRPYKGSRHIQVLRHIGIAVYVLARRGSGAKTDKIVEVQSMFAGGNLYIATNNAPAARWLCDVLNSDWATTYAGLDVVKLDQRWNLMTAEVTKRVIGRIKKRIALYQKNEFTFTTFDSSDEAERSSLEIAKQIWKVARSKNCRIISSEEEFKDSLTKKGKIYVVMDDSQLHAEMNFLPIIDLMDPNELKLVAGKKRQCFTCFVRLAMRKDELPPGTLITQTTSPGNLWKNQLGFIKDGEATNFMGWCEKHSDIKSVVTVLNYEPDKSYIMIGSQSESESESESESDTGEKESPKKKSRTAEPELSEEDDDADVLLEELGIEDEDEGKVATGEKEEK
ncbi:MAG TPA: DUF4157 domain-containing protein [Kofleriaceae bacterium]